MIITRMLALAVRPSIGCRRRRGVEWVNLVNHQTRRWRSRLSTCGWSAADRRCACDYGATQAAGIVTCQKVNRS